MSSTTRSHGLRVHGLLEVQKSPWLPSRSRGGWRWLRLLVLHDSPSYVRYFPFVSLYRHVQSKELPATTEGEWRRRHSSQGHKGGPETVAFNVQGVV